MQGHLRWGMPGDRVAQVERARPDGVSGSADLIRSQSETPVQWTAVYGWLAGGGLQYGPSFQPLSGVSLSRSRGWMSGRTEWGVPGQASAAPCNEGGFYAHPVPLDGSMQLGAGASLGAAPEGRGSPDSPAAPRVPAAVRAQPPAGAHARVARERHPAQTPAPCTGPSARKRATPEALSLAFP